MQNEMKGYAELKSFNDGKRNEGGTVHDAQTKYVNAAVERKKTILWMTPAEIGKMQAEMYAWAMYMAGWSGERCL